MWGDDFLIDHRNIVGEDLDVTFTVTFSDTLETEPNNTPEQAQTLQPKQTFLGRMTAPAPDEDWVKFWSWGGEVRFIGCSNPRPNGMPFSDIKLDLFKEGASGPELIHSNLDASLEIDPLLLYLAPTVGDYYFRVTSEEPSDVWDPGAPTYRCLLLTYPLEDFPAVAEIDSSTVVTGFFDPMKRRDHDIQRFDIEAPVRSRLDVATTTSSPGVAPYFRVYGANGLGLLAEGSLTVGLDLEASSTPYVLIVQNGNDGLPDTSGNPFSFELDVVLTPE
jgi:hypothetical protein